MTGSARQADTSVDSFAGLLVGLGLAVVGGAPFNILPLLTGGAAASLGFSEGQVGVMSLAISVGSGVSALVAGALVRNINWSRAALVSLVGLLLCVAAAMMARGFWIVVILNGLVGFFAGALFALGLTVLSDRSDPSKSFGVANALQVAYQVAAFAAAPLIMNRWGLKGVLAILGFSGLLALPLIRAIPATRRKTAEATRTSPRFFNIATVVALVGFAVFYVNAGAYWTYLELMGHADGLTERFVANAVAVGVAAGILGGILASVMGNRLGSGLPLWIACGLTIVAAFLLKGRFSERAFAVSGLLYFFSWSYALAYQLAVVSSVDATGRGVAVTGAFGYLGSAAGAGLAAYFVSPGDYRAVLWLVVIGVCLSTVLFVAAKALHLREGDRGSVIEVSA